MGKQTKKLKTFSWKGEQGEYLQKLVSEGKLSVCCNQEQFCKIYDASPGDVLKFQMCFQSWKNARRNFKDMAGAQSALGAQKKDAYQASSSVLKLPRQEAEVHQLHCMTHLEPTRRECCWQVESLSGQPSIHTGMTRTRTFAYIFCHPSFWLPS